MTKRSDLIFVPKKCRLPWCSSCGVAYWAKVRARLLPHLSMFKRARLFTLTVDPKNFRSGQEAYLIIEKQEQYIKRLLRLAGFKKAFKVMAFHKAKESRPDGNEWPHWHIVVDMADVGWLDLKSMWKLWRDKWKVGGLDLQVNRKARNAVAAVCYAVSYCQHQSGIVAEWVKDMPRAPRAYECYGELRKALAFADHVEELEYVNEVLTSDKLVHLNIENVTDEEILDGFSGREITYVGDRLNRCDDSVVCFVRDIYEGEDEIVYKYIGDLPFSHGQLCLASKLGMLPVQRVVHDTGSVQTLRLSTPLKPGDDPYEVLERLVTEISSLPFERIPI